MTRPSSSIFSSDSHRYLVAVAVAILILLVSVYALTAGTRALGRGRPAHEQLLSYQVSKIDRHGAPEFLFVGDSSLGNAINAELWTRLTGRTTLNLALTGSHGFVGSFNMLRRVQRSGSPRVVVIMHTADTMMRQAEGGEAVDLTAGIIDPSWSEAVRLAWLRNMRASELISSVNWLAKRGLLAVAGRTPAKASLPVIENDYVRQGAPLTSTKLDQPLQTGAIVPDKARYLDDIADVCREKQLICAYVHGPLADPACSDSDAYFDAVARQIARPGIVLAAVRPVCLSAHEVGDRPDHAHPAAKDAVTRHYMELLAPYLPQSTP